MVGLVHPIHLLARQYFLAVVVVVGLVQERRDQVEMEAAVRVDCQTQTVALERQTQAAAAVVRHQGQARTPAVLAVQA
jgi:hypothetical protein